MKNSPELHRLADSIAGLVATITEIVNAKVQTATHDAVPAQPQPLLQPPAIVEVATHDPVLTKRQLATHFQVSLRTIDNWCQNGYLPHYKIGKVVRFRLGVIQEVARRAGENLWCSCLQQMKDQSARKSGVFYRQKFVYCDLSR